jgi:tetratricopeptide (TPR) repeat protein
VKEKEEGMPEKETTRTWLTRGAKQSNEGKYLEAVECFDKAIEIDPQCAIAWNHKGYVMKRLGKNQEALQAFLNFVQSAGPDQEPRIAKAREIIRELEAMSRPVPVQPKEVWKVGDKIDARYEIRDVRKGGMGTVFVCLDLKTNQPLALKTFHYECFTDKGATERFLQGAEMWIQLGQHENVLRAYFVTVVSGRPFLFLEYVPGDRKYGPDLSGWIWGKGLDLPTTLSFAIQFCRGMEYAGEKFGEINRTFVHRDIKPSNILVTHDKVVKVTDFDLVKTFLALRKNQDAQPVKDEKTGAERHGFTVVGSVCGTPPYMSPEQWEDGGDVDPRSDIYSFGCVLYEMLTGRPPFVSPALESYRTSHLKEPPAPPRIAAPNIPPELNALVMKCLAKSRSERFQDFALLRQALTAIQQGSIAPVATTLGEEEMAELNNRGFSLSVLGKHDEALACFDKILEANPNHYMAWGNKGLVYHALGRHEEALACIEKVIEIKPGDGAAWSKKGLFLWGLGRKEEAKRSVEKAIEIDPRLLEAWLSKGNFLRLEKKYDEAMICYDKCLDIDPRHLDAWFSKGALSADLKKYGKAIECYDRAIEINPANMTVLNDKAAALMFLGRVKEAMQSLDQAIETDPTLFMAWLNKASLLERQGQTAEAALCLEKMLEHEPRDPRAWTHSAEFAVRLGDFAKAALFYGRALELDPRNASAWQGKGYAHHRLDQVGDALDCFNRALEIDPKEPTFWYAKGMVLGATGRYAEALSCLDKALMIEPGFAAALQLKGAALEKLGRPKEAIAAYRLYLKNAEKEPPDMVLEMRAYLKQLERDL